MKLKNFMTNLNRLIINDPSIGELVVVAATDDEGNGFNEVYYAPSIGRFEDREFETYNADFEADEEDAIKEEDINAICIN